MHYCRIIVTFSTKTSKYDEQIAKSDEDKVLKKHISLYNDAISQQNFLGRSKGTICLKK